MTSTNPETPTAAELMRARYGVDLPPAASWSATIGALLAHRSVRSYRATPPPAGALEAMVAAAQSASTSSNLQAWSVVAVEEPDRRRRLSLLTGDQAHVEQAPLFLVWLADLSRLARAAEARGMPHDGLDYTEMFLLAAIDAALAAQNAAVAAESLGLGVVYVGGIRNHPDQVAAELRLPPRAFAVFGMCVGYPGDDAGAVRPRLPQAAVLHREAYASDDEPAALDAYNQAMGAFYRERSMRVRGDWVDHSVRRIAGPAALSGRDTLREHLERMGFPLK